MKWFLDRIMERSVCHKGGSGGSQRIITEDMKAAADVATQQWNDYQVRFVPFENKFMADMTGSLEAKTAQAQGAANADIQQQIATNKSAINPNGAVSPSQETAVGKAMATSDVAGRAGALDNKAKGLQTIVNMGRGQRVDALDNQMALAESSGQAALNQYKMDVQHATNERGMYANTASRAMGAAGAIGANYYGGQQALSNYNKNYGSDSGLSANEVQDGYFTTSSGQNVSTRW